MVHKMHTRRLLFIGLAVVAAQRTATVQEVQPSERDVTHAIWINGPAYSSKLDSSASASWPSFQSSDATRTGTRCATFDHKYTGYDENGRYCKAASSALDDDAHLLLHSGRLGIVMDAGGLQAAVSSNSRNLFPKLGALPATGTAREAYDALQASDTSITLETTCGSETTNYVLGVSGYDSFVQAGLVRQGHAVTQVTLTGIEFQSATSGGVYGPCESFVSSQQSSDDFAAAVGRRLTHRASLHHCNQDYGGASHPCPSSAYPKCVGFVQGSGWGKCWSECTAAGGHPNLWGELSVWGDSIAFELAWDTDFDLGPGCSGAITVAIGEYSNTTSLPMSVSPPSPLAPPSPPTPSHTLCNTGLGWRRTRAPMATCAATPLATGTLRAAARMRRAVGVGPPIQPWPAIPVATLSRATRRSCREGGF
jgi:hypothetical protein